MTLAALIAVALLFGFMVAGLRGAVWVPARTHDTVSLIKSLDLTPDAKIFEFGCGDGRNLKIIKNILPDSQLSAIEINPVMWLVAKLSTSKRAKILLGDGWRANLSDQDVVITFLTPPFMARFERKMLSELKPGSLVISYSFELPNIQPVMQKYNYFVYRISTNH